MSWWEGLLIGLVFGWGLGLAFATWMHGGR